MEELYARKLEVDGRLKYQTLESHISGVRARIDKYSKTTNFNNISEFVALTHDIGKCSRLWQDYLMEERKQNNKIQHSLTGMGLVEDFFENEILNSQHRYNKEHYLTKDLIEYIIGSHHGLFDALDTKNGDQHIERKVNLAREDTSYSSAIEGYLKLFNRDETIEILNNSISSVREAIELIEKSAHENDKNLERFYYGVIVKVLLSMLIDGDWSDARAFEDNFENEYEKELDKFDWNVFIENMEKRLESFEISSEIDKIRKTISSECKESATRKTGIYRLSVPTGGGKTLASMRFALHHAKITNKSRIVYIAPYNSILEQNASVYREVLCNDDTNLEKFILEHHHNVIFENKEEDFDENDALAVEENKKIYRYLSENWSAPIVLTSFVQLLNSLFSSQKSSIRRLHRLSNSVIIIDELQSLPIKSTSIFNATINAISLLFNTTFVLCTASQPPFELVLGEKNRKSIPSINFSKPINLVNEYSDDKVFARVNVTDKTFKYGYELPDILSLIGKTMEQEESLLVILNTKKAVNRVYKELESDENDFTLVCLTTYLVPKHRMQIIQDIKDNLGNKKYLVISTPLIEAGVDISFSGVIRSITGLDSIFQAAGRCNRNGERDRGNLSIINLTKDIENTGKMQEIEIKKEIMQAKLSDFKNNPSKYKNNLLSQESLYSYFKDYYDEISNKAHFDIAGGNDKTIYDLLNYNKKGIAEYKFRTKKNSPNHFINQAFKEAGDAYRAIEDSGATVIVPWEGGQDIINNLYSETLSFGEINQLINQAQVYSVNLFKYEIDRLQSEGALAKIEDKNIYVLNQGYYHPDMGLSLERQLLETASF